MILAKRKTNVVSFACPQKGSVETTYSDRTQQSPCMKVGVSEFVEVKWSQINGAEGQEESCTQREHRTKESSQVFT